MAQKGSTSVKERIETTSKWFASLPSQVEKRAKELTEKKSNRRPYRNSKR